MKYVFIDSNIWLSLYSLTSGDLKQFSKLKGYLNDSIKLVIPSQVKDEVLRNRESRFNETLKGLNNSNIVFPSFTESYPQYESIKSRYKAFKKDFDEWVKNIKEDFLNENSPADKTIMPFFENDMITNCDEEIVSNAIRRFQTGNPPGKDNKFGDSINWECLIKSIPNGNDIYVISDDGDYKSIVEPNKIKAFLAREWKERKEGNVIFYSKLTSFLSDHLSDIKLETEQRKEDLINALRNSSLFKYTHAIIEDLSEVPDWTDTQIEDLCSAAIDNPQVSRIIRDNDIIAFFSTLLEGKEKLSERSKAINEIYRICLEEKKKYESFIFEDIPF